MVQLIDLVYYLGKEEPHAKTQRKQSRKHERAKPRNRTVLRRLSSRIVSSSFSFRVFALSCFRDWSSCKIVACRPALSTKRRHERSAEHPHASRRVHHAGPGG